MEKKDEEGGKSGWTKSMNREEPSIMQERLHIRETATAQ